MPKLLSPRLNRPMLAMPAFSTGTRIRLFTDAADADVVVAGAEADVVVTGAADTDVVGRLVLPMLLIAAVSPGPEVSDPDVKVADVCAADVFALPMLPKPTFESGRGLHCRR